MTSGLRVRRFGSFTLLRTTATLLVACVLAAACSAVPEAQRATASTPTATTPAATTSATATIERAAAESEPSNPASTAPFGFTRYLVDPVTNEAEFVGHWVGDPYMRNADAIFSHESLPNNAYRINRFDLATYEVDQLAVIDVNAAGVWIVAVTETEVIVEVAHGPSSTNNDEGSEYLVFDPATGDVVGRFDTLVPSASEPGACFGRVQDLRVLDDGRLLGRLHSSRPAVVDPITGAITQLVRCGPDRGRIGDFLTGDDFDAATSVAFSQEIPSGRIEELLDVSPGNGAFTIVEGEGDLWWIATFGSNSTNEIWQAAVVVRFDLETNEIVGMWPIGDAAELFDHCDADKPTSCVDRGFENLGWANGHLIADFEDHSGAVPKLFFFDPATGQADVLKLETTDAHEAGWPFSGPTAQLVHTTSEHAWVQFETGVIDPATGTAPEGRWLAKVDIEARTVTRVPVE